MSDPDRIKKLFEDLNSQPPPIAAKPKGRGKHKTATATSEKPPLPPPGEAEGVDTHQLTVTTWAKKRIFLNEPGIENAISQIRSLPGPEETLHSLMGGDFHGFDFIPTIQRLADAPLRGLHIATLGFNQKNNLQLCRMMDEGQIEGPVTVLASMYFAQSDPNVFAKARDELEARGSRLASSRNHAKIIAAQAGDAFIVVETSANLRSCNSLEQFTVTNSEPLYRFHTGWIDRITANHV